MQDNNVYLHIFSWAGLSIGAIHWYGELRFRGHSTGRIERPLSEEDAIQLNRRLRLTHSEDMYKLYKVQAGEMDNRFDREEQVIEAAKEQWMDMFPEGERLVKYREPDIVYSERISNDS